MAESQIFSRLLFKHFKPSAQWIMMHTRADCVFGALNDELVTGILHLVPAPYLTSPYPRGGVFTPSAEATVVGPMRNPEAWIRPIRIHDIRSIDVR